MLKTPENLPSSRWYEVYRRSIIERHISGENGRFFQSVWLVEGEPQFAELGPNMRASAERFADDNMGHDYYAYPAYWPDAKAPLDVAFPGGGDNALLQGGLCMATFAMEALNGLDIYSYDYAW